LPGLLAAPGTDAGMSVVILYTRLGCGLCDKMKAGLEARGYTVEQVDIDRDPELKRRWGRDIPVAVLDGEILAMHRLEGEPRR
jgi:glutaredoxin